MTHAVELRAGHISDIARELAQPTLVVDELEGSAPQPDTITNWSRLQTIVAATIASSKSVTADPEVGRYIAAIVRHHTYGWDVLDHTAADGPDFRADLTEHVGALFSVDLVANLIRRPITGIVTDAHPYLGWALHDELAHALRTHKTSIDALAWEAQTTQQRAFIVSIRAAVDRGFDLMTVYDTHGVPATAAPASRLPDLPRPVIGTG